MLATISRRWIVTAAAAGVISSSAHAANDTWDNGGNDNNWQNALNWLSDIQFPGATSGDTSADVATFDATGPSGTVNLGDTINVAGITLTANAPTVTIGDANDTLILSAAGTVSNASANAQNIGSAGTTITQAGLTTYTNTGTGLLTIAGNIGGATAAITKTGTGALILSGTNTYGGNTTISGGNVTLTGSVGNATTASGAWSQTIAGIVEVNGGSLYASSYNLAGASGTPTLKLTSGTVVINGALTGNNGNTSQASQPYLIDLAGGTFTAGSVGIGRTNNSSTSVPTGGVTNLGFYVHGATANITGAFNVGATAGANSGVNARIGGSGGSSLTVGGLTTVGINNSGRYSVLDVTDTATFNANGGLQLGSGFAGNAAFTLRSNGVANVSGITLGNASQNHATVVTNMLMSLQGGTLNVGSGGIVAGALPTTGAGFMTTINVGSAASATATTIGALADWSSSLKMTLVNSTAAGTPVFRASDNAATPTARHISLSGILSGSGGLTKTGAGMLTLTGANTYTGPTIVKAGTLALGTDAQAAVLSGSGYADIQGGSVVFSYPTGASPIANIKSQIDASYASGFTTGQFRSTGLPAGRTLGYGDNGTDAVTVMFTLPGDADLNGLVNFNDFLVLQNNFGQPGTTFGQGNFDFNGQTDFNDFLALQNNFGQSVTGAAVSFTSAQVAAIQSFAATVPEPTMLAWIGISAVVALRRRRGH